MIYRFAKVIHWQVEKNVFYFNTKQIFVTQFNHAKLFEIEIWYLLHSALISNNSKIFLIKYSKYFLTEIKT